MSETHRLVPVVELEMLEKAREELYDHLSTILPESELIRLTNYTGQIWKVANTKSWGTRVICMEEARKKAVEAVESVSYTPSFAEPKCVTSAAIEAIHKALGVNDE